MTRCGLSDSGTVQRPDPADGSGLGTHPTASPRAKETAPQGKRRGRPRSVSPTQRTLALFRELGYAAEVVEQKVRGKGIMFSRDLFNCLDVVACGHGSIVGLQVTSGSNHAARRSKVLAEPLMRSWLEAGGRLEVVSWSKRGPRGKTKWWGVRRDEVTLKDWLEWNGPAAARGKGDGDGNDDSD